MPEPRHKLDETEIANLVAAEIDSASSYSASELNPDREKANKYYRGEMDDLPHEEGRSGVVDHTVQDVIGWLLPGLMRVFFSADQLVVYEPKQEEDEPGAAQATDYINHIVLNESSAYQVFWDGFHDALLHRNGIVKHFWDDTPEVTTRKQFGLSEDQYTALTASDEVEVLEHTEREEIVPTPMLDPATGQMAIRPVPVTVHDCKFTVEINRGTLKLAAVAPENFLINQEATSVEDARFVGERVMKTRSELLEMGYDEETVDKLPAEGSVEYDMVADSRHERVGFGGGVGSDRSTDEIEVFETYPLIDVDGDGIAERLKVVSAGPAGKEILDWEVWEDDEVPYSDLTPERVPHRWSGRSVFDDTQDIQRIKSVLMRGMLDNLYQSNIPDRAVNIKNVDNPEALFDRQIGNVIRTVGSPADTVVNLTVPFSAQHSFAALEYCDQMVEKRTGVSRSAMGLDPETLQNQSATAANIQQSAQYSKIELIARNFAELGMKRIFRCLLKLVVKHQDRARTVRLRNRWVEMDPSAWNADMDASINVGLGSGSRDRDLMFLGMVRQGQAEAYKLAGGLASAYGRKMAKAMLHTSQKMVEATGLKSPEMYFPEVTDEELADLAKSAGQNPEAQKFQAEMQAEQAKLQAQMQADQAKAQQDGQLKMAIARLDGEIRLQGIEKDMQLRQYQIDKEMALKERQLVAELALKERMALMSAATKSNGAATSGVHVGGDPG